MKKVLVTASSAFPRWRGDPEPRFVYDLTKRLKGCRVTVLVPHHPNAKFHERMEGMDVYRYPYFLPSLERLCYNGGIHANLRRSILARIELPFMIAAQTIFLFFLLLKVRPHVLHAHWIVPQGFIASPFKWIFRYKLVISAHAGDIFIAKHALVKIVSQLTILHASTITANSSYTQRAIKAVGGSARIIPMGVDSSYFKMSPRKRGSRAVLFVGRLAEKKGVRYLIEAMSIVLKRYPRAELTVIGDGPEQEHLLRRVAELGLAENVTFKGALSHDALRREYARADVFVLPSIVMKSGDTEGLGLVLLEAVSSGVPVVATSVGGIVDIVNKDTGVLVRERRSDEIASAIISVFSDQNAALTRARNAQKHIEKYDWDRIAKEFLRVYD